MLTKIWLVSSIAFNLFWSEQSISTEYAQSHGSNFQLLVLSVSQQTFMSIT